MCFFLFYSLFNFYFLIIFMCLFWVFLRVCCVVVAVCLFWFLPFVLDFVCLFVFFFFIFHFFLFSPAVLFGLWALGSPNRGWAWASGVGMPRLGFWTNREFLGLGNINQHALSQRYLSWYQDPAPPNCLQATVLETSHQTTSKTGTHTYTSADRLLKVILSSQTP